MGKNEASGQSKITLKNWAHNLEPWQKVVAIVLSLISAVWIGTEYIRQTARDAVMDEKYLARLSAQVRPTCIVTSKGAIEADFGAMGYLDDVRVIHHPQAYGFELVITPKRYLAHAPLARAVDSNVVPIRMDRGPKYQWSISMFPQMTAQPILSADHGMDTNKVYRFVIEILH